MTLCSQFTRQTAWLECRFVCDYLTATAPTNSSMASSSGYSKRSSSVKRLLQEAKELAGESTNDGIHAAPFEENLYHWHFTIEGPKDSEFDGGLYHGRITVSGCLSLHAVLARRSATSARWTARRADEALNWLHEADYVVCLDCSCRLNTPSKRRVSQGSLCPAHRWLGILETQFYPTVPQE